jgi:hypothetical protein
MTPFACLEATELNRPMAQADQLLNNKAQLLAGTSDNAVPPLEERQADFGHAAVSHRANNHIPQVHAASPNLNSSSQRLANPVARASTHGHTVSTRHVVARMRQTVIQFTIGSEQQESGRHDIQTANVG